MSQFSHEALNSNIDELVVSLRRSLGEGFEELWAVRSQTHGSPVSELPGGDSLDRLLDDIAERAPIGRVVIKSWRIRQHAAKQLALLGR